MAGPTFCSSYERELALETAEKRGIPNAQVQEISVFERNQFGNFDKKYGQFNIRRCDPTPIYNCHGMTFAARRTWITETWAIERILEDDRYEKVCSDEVLPGDTILYFGEDGDIEHSGIVITKPAESPLGVPIVCSKWGKYAEMLHLANNCPYSFANARYYRVKR